MRSTVTITSVSCLSFVSLIIIGGLGETYPDGYRGDEGNAILVNAGLRCAVFTARTEFVRVVVDNCVSDPRKGRHGQAGGDTGNRTKVDMEATEGRVQDVVEDRREDNDTERVKVTDEIIWHAIRLEHCREETRRLAETVVVDVLDREEAEDPSCLECATDVLDELVVPPGMDVLAFCCDHGRFRCVPEAVAADAEDASSSQADAQDADNVGEVAAAGREEDEALAKVELRGLVLIQ